MMTVYALEYACGFESGFRELIGLYSANEKAEEAKIKDIKKNARFEWNYKITPIQIDKAINKVYVEW